MIIHCLGLNHETSTIHLREQLYFSEDQIAPALARYGCGPQKYTSPISELVILSTCNRVELYAVASSLAFDELEQFLAEAQNIPRQNFSEHLYHLTNEEAVEHLLRVAAGLDSQVLGEPQILGQVTRALELARSQGTTGKILSRLFQTAIHAGKRARTETRISHNPASISSVAVRLIAKLVSDLKNAQITVLGAGEMAKLAVIALGKRGVSHIQVVNRTLERAQRLAKMVNAQAATFERLPEILSQTDVLITSTGAPHTLISPKMVTSALQGRPDRPLVIMDIAVPRDVDVRVGEIEGVFLYDLDDLSGRLEESIRLRSQEVPKVKRILEEEQANFMGFFASLDVLPLIINLRQRADEIRQCELEKTLPRLSHLSPDEQETVIAMSKSIVKKILHTPTVRLQSEANSPQAAEYANLARFLFGLD